MSKRRKQIKRNRWLYRHVPIYRGAIDAKRDRGRSRWRNAIIIEDGRSIRDCFERVLMGLR